MDRIKRFNAAVSSPITRSNFALHPAVLMTAGIMCLTALLGFYLLGHKSFWFDEGISITVVKPGISTTINYIIHGGGNMGLYFLLLDPWIKLGDSEFVVRSLSVVFAVLTIPVIVAIGARLFNKWVGLLAALFLAVNPYFIRFAQEARSYTLLLLMGGLSSYILIRAVQKPSKRLWAAYTVSGILLAFTHVYGILLLAAHAVSLLLLRRKDIPWRGLLISWTVMALFIVPLVYSILKYAGHDLDWISRPGVGDVITFMTTIAGGQLLLGVFAVLGIIALDYAIREWAVSKFSHKTWYFALLFSWMLVPIALSFGISQVKPVLESRYLIICGAPLMVLAAYGISRIPRWWIVILSIVVILTISGSRLQSYYSNSDKEEWRGVTTFVLSRTEAGDAIVFYAPHVSITYDYYVEKAGALAVAPVNVPYYDPIANPNTTVLNNPEGYDVGGPLPPPDPALTDRLANYDRVWLVLSHDGSPSSRVGQNEAVQDMLQAKYGTPEETDFYGIRVLLY